MNNNNEQGSAGAPQERAAVPEGFVLVPVKPTGAMLEAAAKADDEGFEAGRSHGASASEIYDAMLAAAPASPVAQEGVQSPTVPPAEQALALFDLLQRWASWIVRERPKNLMDHACARCAPHSDMLVEGFSCVYHEALDTIGGLIPLAATSNTNTTHPTPSDSASVDTAELNKLAAVFIACVQREQVSAGKVAWQQIITHIESLVTAAVATAQGMADCMDMVREELIEAGIIDKKTAPMFITEAVMRHIAGVRKDAERFGQAIAWEDNVEALHAAVMNNAPDAEAIRREFDAEIAAHSPATGSKES